MKQAFLLFALALFVAGEASASITLLKARRLLDPRTGKVLSPAAVLIEDNKVKEVGSPEQLQAHVSGDTKAIDLGNATLLPGLIDSHTHLFIDIVRPAEAESQRRHYRTGARSFCDERRRSSEE